MIKKIFFLSFLLLSCSFSQDYSNIKVIEVIDGDTIKLSNGKLLRYIGIDTPEVRIKKGSQFIYDPQPFAREATQFNKKLVEGKFIKVEFDLQKTDRYGRLLGYCFIKDTFINAELIKNGYAVLYTYPPNVKYVDLLLKLQKEARNRKVGLWKNFSVISADQAYKHLNQIKIVEGRVLDTYKTAKCVFLNFGNDYKTDFTVVIFKNSLAEFYNIGIDPVDFYKHKKIAVNGRIKEYNGPEIIANSPYQIEVISE